MRRKWGEEDKKTEGEKEQGDGEEEAVVEKMLEGV